MFCIVSFVTVKDFVTLFEGKCYINQVLVTCGSKHMDLSPCVLRKSRCQTKSRAWCVGYRYRYKTVAYSTFGLFDHLVDVFRRVIILYFACRSQGGKHIMCWFDLTSCLWHSSLLATLAVQVNNQSSSGLDKPDWLFTCWSLCICDKTSHPVD